MTPKQRFLAALRLEEPDVVPVSPLIHNRFAHKVLGRTGWRAVFELHRMLGTVHFRGPISVAVRSKLPDGWGEEWEVERGPEGRVVERRTLRTPFGALTSTHLSGTIPHDPLVGRFVEYLIKSPEDWRIYIAYLERWLEGAEVDISLVEEACEEMGEEGVPSVGVGSVFSHLGSVRGMEGLLYDLYDCPDLVLEAAEMAWGLVELQVEGFLRSRAEVMWYDICWATGAGMSPEFFRRFELPFCERVVGKVRQVPGKFVGFYTLGRIRRLLPMLVGTGAHFIETFEPNEGDITLAEAKALYGDRVCLMGNFDCVVLARGGVEEARREALRCLKEGAAGGGYVMVTGDEVPADAKWENLRAMVEVAEEFGRYGRV